MSKKSPIGGTVSERSQLLLQATELIQLARARVVSHTNSLMVFTYFQIGRLIVLHEQGGNRKATYGKATVWALSKKLSAEFGKGFSVRNIEQMRAFYLAYSAKLLAVAKPQTKSAKLPTVSKAQTLSADLLHTDSAAFEQHNFRNWFPLSWSHYVSLIRLQDEAERSFYEIEAIQGNWSVRELQRQIDSSLYERLVLSKNKEQVKQLAAKGQLIEKPEDVLKTPYVLEFLGLDDKSSYSESDLEAAIIDKIEHFLLEMGKGFLFGGRQVRFSIEDENFYVDLVLYNRLLQCFVLLDLKIGRLKHQDIGQMQMYVNYYDRYVKQAFEKPTIGIIVCKDKSDAVVEITLPQDNQQIFAAQYKLYLPTKSQLKRLITQ
jgi:predicted nuclease of restriction endonuclease-like (RecB) superfamily